LVMRCERWNWTKSFVMKVWEMELEPKSCEEVRDWYINWYLGVNYKVTTKSDGSLRDEIGILVFFFFFGLWSVRLVHINIKPKKIVMKCKRWNCDDDVRDSFVVPTSLSKFCSGWVDSWVPNLVCGTNGESLLNACFERRNCK
jgi:hypothetical protein